MTEQSLSLRLRTLIKRFAVPLAVFWTLSILTVLLIPGKHLPSSGVGFDKVAHFVIFSGFSGLWMVALGDKLRGAAFYVFVLGISYGIATEIAQELLPGGRHGDLWDATANTAGILIGIFAFVIWRRIHPKQD